MAREDATVTPQITRNSTSPSCHLVQHTSLPQDVVAVVVVVEIRKDTCVAACTQCQLKPTEMLVRLLSRAGKYDDDEEGIDECECMMMMMMIAKRAMPEIERSN